MDNEKTCNECGIPVAQGEYPPYTACRLFKQCHNSETVRANLNAVAEHAIASRTVPQWISVKNKLPENNTDVLAWCGWCITSRFKCGTWGHEFRTEDLTNPIYHVTHWMPLPQPPLSAAREG